MQSPPHSWSTSGSSLPEAVRATSESGEQLLAAVRERTGQPESTQSWNVGANTTFLYDEGGRNVREGDQLTGLLESAEDDVWLVPAIALQRSVDDEHSEDRHPSVPPGHTLSVASAVERLSINSRNSSLSQMMSGLVSRCGSARCVSRLVTDQILSRIIG